MNKKTLEKGFTLIELLAVILILGIIALIAIPTVNKLLKESKMGAFNTTAVTLGNKAEEACQLENLKGHETTSLYTIVEGKLDKPLDIKGDLPREGYILVNNKCEVAYSFYDENNVVSKNFKETKAIVNNKDTAPSYGLKWQSYTVEGNNYLDDTYTRTLDASNIDDESVNMQKSETPVTNAFDTLDIYKDIVPYTDEFGNEFMLIPKFYISKTKEVTDTEVIWNYAISKHKLDDTYYLPSNFVDEGIDNNKHIELPYVLVGKYKSGSNGLTGDSEMLVSKSGIKPKVSIDINAFRTLTTRYNDLDGVNGYQQYDIHVQDLITMLFAIEFKTMNSQNVVKGNVFNANMDNAIKTGDSDLVKSSSGTILNDGHRSFHYRGIENIWGNIRTFLEGVNMEQVNGNSRTIYATLNARYYSADNVTKYENKITEYNIVEERGFVIESGFDKNSPFINLPTKVSEKINKGVDDEFYLPTYDGYIIAQQGGDWDTGYPAGLNSYRLCWYSNKSAIDVGSRLIKTPLQ